MSNDESGQSNRLVTIAVLTYCRIFELRRCLDSVNNQLERPEASSGAGWRTLEVVVVDNDPERSAAELVSEYRADNPSAKHELRYLHAPNPGVAAARNTALEGARGNLLVFIDDDEVARDQWPEGLVTTMLETNAALVGGPVDTEFTTPPPDWISDGGFFDRTSPPHRSDQEWLRSGNLAIDLDQIQGIQLRFDETYAQGEDVNFSRRAAAAGLGLRWSRKGRIVEFVDRDRFSPEWRLRRERLATFGWARTELDLDGSPRSMAVSLARAATRTLGGSVMYATGVVRRDQVTRMRARSHLARARGRLDALRAYVEG